MKMTEIRMVVSVMWETEDFISQVNYATTKLIVKKDQIKDRCEGKIFKESQKGAKDVMRMVSPCVR